MKKKTSPPAYWEDETPEAVAMDFGKFDLRAIIDCTKSGFDQSRDFHLDLGLCHWTLTSSKQHCLVPCGNALARD